jgi:hypothetical protein
MQSFWDALQEQRWDDHRFYHHSRINQSLHAVSAMCFLSSYVLILLNRPIAATMIGWLLAMVLRQSGHFFFEPHGYDHENDVTFEYKEQVKVGYNLFRKIVLLAIWAAIPVLLLFIPSFFGLFAVEPGLENFAHRVAVLWLLLGGAAVLFRTVQLFFVRDVQTGLVWATKILTDPFHDIKIYHRAPLALMRGEWLEPLRTDFRSSR